MAGLLRVGAVGAIIRRTVIDSSTGAAADLSSTVTRTLKLEKPGGGEVIERAAVFTNSGTDGQMQYTTIAGDLDMQGAWRGQFYFEFSPTQKFHTDVFRVNVGGNLNG